MADYDRRVHAGLSAAGAERVFDLHEFDAYRIDRAKVLALMEVALPVTRFLPLTA